MKLPCTLVISTLLCLVRANCEHAHFHGPPATPYGGDNGLLQYLNVLTPTSPSLQVLLPSRFPPPDTLRESSHPQGLATWFLLDNLVPGQRYEARACYAATQPTDLRLDTFELHAVATDPVVAASLAESIARSNVSAPTAATAATLSPPSSSSSFSTKSTLLLRIIATADYVSDHPALLAHVPPTYAEIILDPWIYGLAPATAVPIAGYIVAVFILAIPLARAIVGVLEAIARDSMARDKKVQ